MHCNLIIENLELRNEVEETLSKLLIENIQVFDNYYLLRLRNKWEWNLVLTNIGQIAGVRFVLTPILEEGFYNGILSPEEWRVINGITQNRGEISE